MSEKLFDGFERKIETLYLCYLSMKQSAGKVSEDLFLHDVAMIELLAMFSKEDKNILYKYSLYFLNVFLANDKKTKIIKDLFKIVKDDQKKEIYSIVTMLKLMQMTRKDVDPESIKGFIKEYNNDN